MKIKTFIISFLIFFCINLFTNTKEYDYNISVQNKGISFSNIEIPTLNTLNSYDEFRDDKKNDISLKKYLELKNELKSKIIQKQLFLENKTNINVGYIPENFEKDFLDSQKSKILKKIIYSKIFISKKLNFNLILSKDSFTVRGNYKDDFIRIFGVEELPLEEFILVCIHELGHYIDMNHLKNNFFGKNSKDFYNISWKDTFILEKESTSRDFVSGYAMTNKFEDFAESFNFYIFFNDDFLEKTKKSVKLRKKYDFFTKNLFTNGEFQNTSFKKEEKIKIYNWDTTKIKIDLEKVLEYFQNGI